MLVLHRQPILILHHLQMQINMGDILRTFFNWSEVWALLIPLAVLLYHKPKGKWITPLVWYILMGLILNILIDFYWYVNMYGWFGSGPDHYWNNNIFYKLHSIARVIFFSWFFATQGKGFKLITKVIPVIFLLSTLIFFTSLKDALFSYFMATEAGLLLIYCLWYTNIFIKEERPSYSSMHPPLWVVGGLTLYTAVNFFLFLFYDYLIKNFRKYSVDIWDIHNILFIALCICIAIAFKNESTRK